MKQDVKTSTQTLIDERTRLAAEVDALQNQIRGLDLAIELLNASAINTETARHRARGISDTIRDLLKDAGPDGLTVPAAVELAAGRGQRLNRTSVSSLLSRMKRGGEVVYRRKKYVLR